VSNKRALVTGGAGFIGSHLVEALLEKGFSVHVLDNLSMGKRECVPQEATFFEGDIRDPVQVQRALEEVDIVFHLAARVAIRDSFNHFYDDAHTNVMGTLNLLRHCGTRGVKKFVFASSMAVYADSVTPEPIAETYPQEPISPYGISKLAAERYILLMSKQLGMESICLRYFNVYGPRQSFTLYVGVITVFVQRLQRGQPPIIFGDGKQQRDFINVKDVVHATILASESDLKREVLNVGTGTGTSVEHIAHLLIHKLDPDVKPMYELPHCGEIRNSIADISKIRRLLGFQPSRRLDDEINEVIEWIQGHAMA